MYKDMDEESDVELESQNNKNDYQYFFKVFEFFKVQICFVYKLCMFY